MENKDIIIVSLIILGAAIFVPIVVNIILSISIGVPVIGESKDWLSFFGSYLGGVFTAYISFVILTKTIKHNLAIFTYQQKKQDLESLKKMLSEQVSILNFSKIGEIALVITDSSQYPLEKQKLNFFHEELALKYKSYKLLYVNSVEQPVIDYWDSYQQCVKQLFDDIKDMTSLIADLPPHLDDMEIDFMNTQIREYQKASKDVSFAPPLVVREQIESYKMRLKENDRRSSLLEDIRSLVFKLDEHKSYEENVFSKAQLWIESEQHELESIMN